MLASEAAESTSYGAMHPLHERGWRLHEIAQWSQSALAAEPQLFQRAQVATAAHGLARQDTAVPGQAPPY